MFKNDTYEYMDESSIHPLLKCKLCSKPFIDPVSTQNGDRFCRPCISHIVRRDPDTSSEISTNNGYELSRLQSLIPITEQLVIDILNSFLVRCKQCEKPNIPRGLLEKHKHTDCPKVPILCPAADIKCSWIGTRQDLDDHLYECKFQPLRSALEGIFNDHNQLKNQIRNLETYFNELLVKKDFE